MVDAADAPDSETDAIATLRQEGFDGDLSLRDGCVVCSMCGDDHDASDAEVERTFRFEGTSNPGDEAIVLGLRCPHCGRRGVLVSAFGPDADPALATLYGKAGPGGTVVSGA